MTRNLFHHVEKAARFSALLVSSALICVAVALTIKLSILDNITPLAFGIAGIALTAAWVIIKGEKQTVKRGIWECLMGSAGGTLCIVILFPDFSAAHDLRTWLQSLVLAGACLVAGYFTLICILSGSAHAVYRLRF